MAVWWEMRRGFEFSRLIICRCTHARWQRCASFSCLFSYGVGSIQGLTEIYSRHTEKLARLFTLCLKQQSFPRLIWSLARLLEFKMAWGLLSSVTWDALTFRNFVQDLLCIKLRSLCGSKYGLKNCHNTC